MQTAEKVLLALTGVAMATTLLLPGRQTPAVIDKTFGGLAHLFSKAMGR